MRGSWHTRIAAAALALTLGTTACSDSSVGPGEWTIDDLEGTWTITRFEYTADADPDDTFDAIEEGQTGTFVINGNGNYTFTRTVQGLPPVIVNGTFTIDGNGNVVDSNEGGTIDITRDGDTIIIHDESVVFDFDNNPGTPDEQADLLIEMDKTD